MNLLKNPVNARPHIRLQFWENDFFQDPASAFTVDLDLKGSNPGFFNLMVDDGWFVGRWVHFEMFNGLVLVGWDGFDDYLDQRKLFFNGSLEVQPKHLVLLLIVFSRGAVVCAVDAIKLS